MREKDLLGNICVSFREKAKFEFFFLIFTLKLWSSCLFEAVRTNPGYGMATLIYNNLLNLISGTVMLLRSNYIIQVQILLYLFK